MTGAREDQTSTFSVYGDEMTGAVHTPPAPHRAGASSKRP